jgi:membrane protease YdiL (CAAX protease family)
MRSFFYLSAISCAIFDKIIYSTGISRQTVFHGEGEKAHMNTDIFFAKGETVKEASAHKGLFYPLEIVVFLVIFYASQIVASYLLSVINAARNSGAKNAGYDSYTLLIYLYITAVTIGIFVLYAVLVQKRSLRGLGFAVKKIRIAKEYGCGLLIGLCMIFAVVLGEMLIGGVKFTGISLSADTVPLILLIFIGYMIQGMEEEVVTRGFLMISIARRYPVWVGILTNALLFGLLHMFNPGATVFSVINTVLHGILYSLFFLKRDSVWLDGGVHSGWNFSQSCIFGQHTSGMPLMASVFAMTSPTGKSFLTGGDYGLEASVISTVVSVIVFILLLKAPDKQNSKQKIIH